MKIVKVLEHMTGHSGPWYEKDIEQAIEKIRIHKENRERIATANMQALMSRYDVFEVHPQIAEEAVAWADILIEELNK